MRRTTVTVLLLLAACSRETPAPPATTSPAPPPVTTTTAAVPQPAQASYTDAMTWFATAKDFHFVVDEDGVKAEGELTRPRIGQESVRFRANGSEYTAAAGPQGVTWKPSQPAFGGRLWQRVTVAFDPQKKEGSAQTVGIEDGATHFRFTNANTLEVHDVWVRDGCIERMQIGGKFSMTLKP